MGEPADGHFGDRRLFGMMFALNLLELTPSTCLVATSEEQVVGYCLVAPDTYAYRAWQRKVYTPRVMRRIFGTTLWRWPGDVWRLARCDFARALRKGVDVVAQYPAHLHINVLQDFQRCGVGHALIREALESLRRNGVTGLHLHTTSGNTKALPFYRRLGFKELKSGGSTMWPESGAQAICMGMRLTRVAD